MNIIQIFRMHNRLDFTMGVVTVNHEFCCYSMEPPDRGNIKDHSCILPGQYYFEVYDSPKFDAKCLKLFDVPGRNFISMHYGNTVKDTKGCILVGQKRGEHDYIMESRATLSHIISLLDGEPNGIIEIS